MSNKIYSFSGKMGIELVSLLIYENKLIIKNNNLNQVVEYAHIKSLFFNENNNNELQILTEKNTISINVIDTKDKTFDEALDFINNKLNQHNSTKTFDYTKFDEKEHALNILLNVKTKIRETNNVINSLYNLTTFKKERNLTNTPEIIEYTNCTIYSNHIVIDNPVFTQEIPYSLIKNVILNENNPSIDINEVKIILKLVLLDNQNIDLYFMEYNKNESFELYNLILPKIQNAENISIEEFKKYHKNSVVPKNYTNSQNTRNNINRDEKSNNNLFIDSMENSYKLTSNLLNNNLSNSKYLFKESMENTFKQTSNILNNYGSESNKNRSYYSHEANVNHITNQKSVLIAIILHFFFIGLGYGYLGNWKKFFMTFGASLLCILLSFLLIPLLFLPIIWFYALFDIINMVERYNNGERF